MPAIGVLGGSMAAVWVSFSTLPGAVQRIDEEVEDLALSGRDLASKGEHVER